jgi:hypothetical protein
MQIALECRCSLVRFDPGGLENPIAEPAVGNFRLDCVEQEKTALAVTDEGEPG